MWSTIVDDHILIYNHVITNLRRETYGSFSRRPNGQRADLLFSLYMSPQDPVGKQEMEPSTPGLLKSKHLNILGKNHTAHFPWQLKRWFTFTVIHTTAFGIIQGICCFQRKLSEMGRDTLSVDNAVARAGFRAGEKEGDSVLGTSVHLAAGEKLLPPHALAGAFHASD